MNPDTSATAGAFGWPEHLAVRGTSLDDPSGAARAQEAHDAGAVEPVVEYPVHEVTVSFKVHGPLALANELADALAANLLLHHAVMAPVTMTVTDGAAT